MRAKVRRAAVAREAVDLVQERQEGYSNMPETLPSSPLIHLTNVTKAYDIGEEQFFALRETSLEISQGEYVAIVGPSGSGKSTLMNILGCLDRPTSGEYLLAGRSSRLDSVLQ